jgi:hypothetical protein
MYVTGLRRDSKKELFVPRNASERKKQRDILEREYLKGTSPPSSRRKSRKR